MSVQTDKRQQELERASRVLGRVLSPRTPLPRSLPGDGRPFEVAALLSSEFGVALRPVTVAEHLDPLGKVRKVLDAASIRTRPVTLAPGWSSANAHPMVVVVDGSAAVVLQGSGFEPMLHRVGEEAVRVDSAWEQRISPAALEAIRPLPTHVRSLSALLRWSARPSRWVSPIAILASVFAGVLSLALPLVIDAIFNDAVPAGDITRTAGLTLVLACLSVAAAAFTYVRITAAIRATDSIEGVIAGGILDRFLRLPLSTVRGWSTAELSRRLLIQVPLVDLVSDVLAIGVFAFSVTIVNAFIALVISTPLGIVTLATATAMLLITYAGLRVERSRRLEEMARQDRSEEIVLDFTRGWTPLRVNAGEEFAFARWADAYAATRRAFMRRWSTEVAFDTARALTASAGLIGLVLTSNTVGSIPSGTFLAALTAYTQCLLGVAGIVLCARTVARALPLVDRVQPLLTAAPEDSGEREDPGTLQGALSVRNVGFRYGGDEAWVLRDVSFSADAGSFIAIVGTSGSGKSTLLRLLMGLDKPTTGAIAIDGADLSTLEPQAVRRQFGAVLQSSLLLPGTIRANLTACSGPVDDSVIWELLEGVAGAQAVREMPLGLDTYIDEGSTVISGGQRQRLLLARALLARPSMVFLDEATSALDNVTQAAVSETIEQLPVTRIAIAHRLGTVRRADHVIVLDEGRIVQQGRFDELRSVDGLFRTMIERQEL